MVLLRDVDQVVAHFGSFGDSVILTQDGYTVCAECAIGSKIVLGTADGTPTSNGLSEIFFGPYGDSVNVGVR
jgi:hypothetical protein